MRSLIENDHIYFGLKLEMYHRKSKMCRGTQIFVILFKLHIGVASSNVEEECKGDKNPVTSQKYISSTFGRGFNVLYISVIRKSLLVCTLHLSYREWKNNKI